MHAHLTQSCTEHGFQIMSPNQWSQDVKDGCSCANCKPASFTGTQPAVLLMLNCCCKVMHVLLKIASVGSARCSAAQWIWTSPLCNRPFETNSSAPPIPSLAVNIYKQFLAVKQLKLCRQTEQRYKSSVRLAHDLQGVMGIHPRHVSRNILFPHRIRQ